MGTGIVQSGSEGEQSRRDKPLISFGSNGMPNINIPGLSNGRGQSGNGGANRGQGGNYSQQNQAIASSTSSNDTANSSQTNKLPITKFNEIKLVTIETGLDDGKNTEVKSGLSEGDYIFSIFPKSDAEKKQLETEYLIKK